MDSETITWLLAIPGSIAATISLPLVIRKQILECRKLDLEVTAKTIEVEKLGKPFREIKQQKRNRSAAIMRWFATWGIGIQATTLAIAMIWSAIANSSFIVLMGWILSAVLGLVTLYCSVELPWRELRNSVADLRDSFEDERFGWDDPKD